MTNVQLVSAMLDALAAFRGITLTTEQKLQLAREFTNNYNPDITNEDLAMDFLDQMVKMIRKRGRYFVNANRQIRLAAESEAEMNAALCNFGPDPEPEPVEPPPPEEEPTP